MNPFKSLLGALLIKVRKALLVYRTRFFRSGCEHSVTKVYSPNGLNRELGLLQMAKDKNIKTRNKYLYLQFSKKTF